MNSWGAVGPGVSLGGGWSHGGRERVPGQPRGA